MAGGFLGRRCLVALALAFLVLFASPAAAASPSSAARGMARTEAQARAAYELWLARHGKARNALGMRGDHEHRYRALDPLGSARCRSVGLMSFQ
ncbi:unnamed protein product [Urochloa humidicola]